MVYLAAVILNYFAIPGMRLQVHTETISKTVLLACLAMNINPKKLISTSRLRVLVNARGICYIILRQLNPSLTLKEIGNYFNRDHTTVMNGIRETRNELSYNEELQQKLVTVQSRLQTLP